MDKDSTQEISKDRIYDATATTGSLTPLPLDDITVAESVVQHDRDVLLSPKPQHNASVHAISSNPESRRNTPDYSSQGSSTVNSAPFASKRFSAVNINKKFLEKNSSAGSSLTTHSVQSNGTSKLGSSMAAYSQSAARPGFQSVSSHSKLVTTKLTTSAPAATPTPGWSRPSSVAPLASPSQSIPSGRGILSGAANSHNQVQLQNTNKNTQIQSQTTSTARFENPSQSSRPVWRNLAGGTSRTTSGAQYDFPTAAEAARASLFKPSESRFPTDNVPLPNGNMLETAAAFRGAHLDPNAHHWDEMEEDDNDFLDAVIEFGDGTQYKVNVENQLSQKSPYMVDTVPEGSKSTDDRLLEVPISKEERLPDDFDRSWPPKPSYTSQSDETDKGQRMVNGSNSRFRTSLNDAAHTRVLFNERSNRMEIYGSGNNPWQNGSSTQSRGPPNNVQVLQKLDRLRIAETQDNEHLEVSKTAQRDKMRVEIENSGDESIVVDIPDSSREMSLNVIVSVNANEPEKSKETNDAQPHSPNLSLQSAASHTSNQFSAAEIPLSPSVPNSASSDPPRSYSSLSSRTAMTSALSVRSTVQSPQNGPDNVDVELLRKSYLHISAERAKERKRQEEEERLKAQERARQKALELEKKLQIVSPITSVSSDEIGLDNVAIAKVVTQSLHDVQKQERPDTSIIFDKTVSAIHNLDDKIISKQSHITRKSVGKGPVPSSGHPSSTHRQAALNGSVEEDLWRTGGSSSANSKYEMLVSQKNLEFGCLDVRPDEIVQILDFSDISQLVPAEDVSIHDDRKHSRATPYTATHSQPNDNASSSKNDIRRGQQEDSFTVGTDTIDGPEQGENQADSINAGVDRVNKLNDDGQQSMNRISGSSISASHITIPVWSNYPPHQDSALKSPRSTLYREVPMSALTDTMSRIKGAMHGLQTSNGLDASQDNVDVIADKQQHGRSIKEAKWLPPALRNFSALRSREPFITHPEPLFVSAPANHDVAVRLPKRSRRLERSPRKQYAHWKVPNKYPAISSRDFRIEGRMLSYIVLDTVLFQNPEIFNGGKPTYTVLLPASTSVRPRVNLPKSSFRGIMGTRGNADSVTWQLSQLENTTQVDEPKLRIISRSPPPQTLSTTITLSLKSKSDQALKILQSKAKAAHRSASADVAFYRDIRASSSSSNILASVKFTVLSELDEKGVKDRTIRAISASQKEDDIQGRVNIGDIPSTSGGEEVSGSSKFSGSQQSASETKGANLSSTVEKRGAEESVDPKKSTLTKPSLPTWGRGPLFHIEGSTADPPNSELLKAVWSQASDGDALPTVNSLKGFADDLSAVPFILHEVKSDDGGTPPPASSSQALSFSASDVARSFQTVPSSSKEDTSSSSSSLSAPYFPAVPNTQTFLRHNGSMPRSPVAVPIGPQYGSYPSPMMSHSPSPTLLYTQQHNLGSMPSPQYGQPIWMPLSGAMQPHGSPPQYTAPYYHYTPAMGQPVYPTIQHAPRFYSNGMHQHIPLVSPPAAAPLAQPHPTAYTPASASSPLLRTTSQAPSNQGHNYPANVDLNKNYAPSHGHYTNHTPMAAPSPRTQIPSSYSTQSSNSRPSW